MKSKVFHSIQMLRAVAASAVVFFHAYQNASWAGFAQISPRKYYLFNFGGVGVHIFFVISGFVMITAASSNKKYSIFDFLRKRFLRIYPIYWVALIFTAIVFLFTRSDMSFSFGRFLGCALLLPGYAPAIIAPAWTLSYEVYFYICFSLAMLFGLTRGLLVLGLSFVVMIGLRTKFNTSNAFMDMATNSLLIEFVAGATIGWLTLNMPLPRFVGPPLVAIAIAGYVIGLLYGYDRLPSVLAWGFPSALLVAGAIAWESGQASPFVKAMGKFGDGSYVLYLIHKAILFAIVAIVVRIFQAKSVDAMAFTLICSAICLVCGEFASRYIEKPLLRVFRPAAGAPVASR